MRLPVTTTGARQDDLYAEAATLFGPALQRLVVDAQLSFVTNTAGQATAVILHQNGANLTGQRIN